MLYSTLTAKGQTTIPKTVRDELGVKSGEQLSFTVLPGGVVLMRAKSKALDEVAGSLRRKGQRALPVELLSR